MLKNLDSYREQSLYSDPGEFGVLLEGLPGDVRIISAVARNLFAHYAVEAAFLPDYSRADINLRNLKKQLQLDQERNGKTLTAERQTSEKLQGCCRDMALFSVGVLRAHKVPARTRVGFAGYITQGWHYDHVVVESYIDGKWQVFDPQIPVPAEGTIEDTFNLKLNESDKGFVTASYVWKNWREGNLKLESYGIKPGLGADERFIFNEVLLEAAHRFKRELLLWDNWGPMPLPGERVNGKNLNAVDVLAEALLKADESRLQDSEAQAIWEKLELAPGELITEVDPINGKIRKIDLSVKF